VPLKENKGLDSKVTYFAESMNFIALIRDSDIDILKINYPIEAIRHADRKNSNVILTPGVSQSFLSILKAANLKVKLIPDELSLKDVLALISKGAV